MKNGFYDEIRLCYVESTLRQQSIPELIVAMGSAVTAGVARLLVPFPLNR